MIFQKKIIHFKIRGTYILSLREKINKNRKENREKEKEETIVLMKF